MRLAPSRIGIRHQLLGLFGLFLATGALVLVLDEVGQHFAQQSLVGMRDEVLAGMRGIENDVLNPQPQQVPGLDIGAPVVQRIPGR